MQPKAKGLLTCPLSQIFCRKLVSVDQDIKIRYVRRRTSFHE
ncbi:unnamed protein product [Arabidopsis thaliana]|uniref:Uncharacterized protein n=4 Tax=Arabidopsis TaxID=3701 RepID=A0A654EYT5_ARATH|nr:uncharacterized protein AT2G29628 [Arabidopsis thaliana]KAG7637908.1 hypothetical protein ISN45_At02g023980 [Arabidopsis thaliana x Arabidopsis arenosa]KAG7642504.1 hypothetical protein ISN44_As02g024130 [Arabidopsis suecica]AEC08280.1 hypothetical protein AT2G29628 [Arabidopsis thaliana]CAA0373272.1 unnamed protein product [Arabidopsis thaliana]VYS53908.1 unnamed protein product [Arabidopsis thaliana]|eukprot:NP_001118411.1 hypothetical protein AT2G29628 [Arabidopsis thaliana]